jgi:hypothetical protein
MVSLLVEVAVAEVEVAVVEGPLGVARVACAEVAYVWAHWAHNASTSQTSARNIEPPENAICVYVEVGEFGSVEFILVCRRTRLVFALERKAGDVRVSMNDPVLTNH